MPFVSQQAACLGVGRLIGAEVGIDGLPNFVQYDALIGPQATTRQSRMPSPICYCRQRVATIDVHGARRRRHDPLLFFLRSSLLVGGWWLPSSDVTTEKRGTDQSSRRGDEPDDHCDDPVGGLQLE